MVMLTVLALAQELEENPDYKAWARFKPGSSVTIRSESYVGGKLDQVIQDETTTLIEVSAEKVILETRTILLPGDLNMDRGTVRHETAAKRKHVDAEETAEQKLLKKEGKEEIEVAGKKRSCCWVQKSYTIQGKENLSKLWTCDDLPGGQARCEWRCISDPEGTFRRSQVVSVVVK